MTAERMLACFRKGVEQRGDTMEWVEVPYKNTSLPALFVPAQCSEPTAPCLIHFDGLDVMKEFLYLSQVAHEYNRRGVSVSHWVEHMNWVFGTGSTDEFLDAARRMNLTEALPNIRCPLLVVRGAGDRQIPVQMV